MGRKEHAYVDENLLPHQPLSTFSFHLPTAALVPVSCPTGAVPLSYLFPKCPRGEKKKKNPA